MNKTILGVAMVVAFCITWWLVAGEAWRATQKVVQAKQQAEQAQQAYEQAFEKAYEQAYDQPPQTYEQADALFHTRASWGVGAGLLVDVLLLVGIVAWQKITFKP